ncbi:MAG: tRNA (N6-threonylcarbamoyladenosine(37)-N6)-methyltransferase TrmO [Thermodesulfobacteriota bacterium]
MSRITLRPIGRVRNSIRHLKREGWESVISEIVLDPQYSEALDGIEDYSHILVLFWISRLPPTQRKIKKIHPKSRPDLPLVGIFATRTQYRPNPIGLTLVKLISRKNNVLKVKGLDALQGTPVIDIKPISPRHEFLQKYRLPKWYAKLWVKPRPALRRGKK